jgi:hypothetical protein
MYFSFLSGKHGNGTLEYPGKKKEATKKVIKTTKKKKTCRKLRK